MAGISHGSSLGPLLFSTYTNDLPSILENSENSLYADDTNLSTSDEILSNGQQNLNKDLKNIRQLATCEQSVCKPCQN